MANGIYQPIDLSVAGGINQDALQTNLFGAGKFGDVFGGGAGSDPGGLNANSFNWFGKGGAFGPAAQGIGSILGGISAFQTAGIAKDNLDFQKDAFGDQLARLDQDYRNQLENQYRRQNIGRDINSSDLQSYIDARSV